MTFLYFREIPIIAILHEDGIRNVSVKAYPLYTREIGNEVWSLDDLDESTQIIKAVPNGKNFFCLINQSIDSLIIFIRECLCLIKFNIYYYI